MKKCLTVRYSRIGTVIVSKKKLSPSARYLTTVVIIMSTRTEVNRSGNNTNDNDRGNLEEKHLQISLSRHIRARKMQHERTGLI